MVTFPIKFNGASSNGLNNPNPISGSTPSMVSPSTGTNPLGALSKILTPISYSSVQSPQVNSSTPGVKAANPSQNITPPKNTLSSSQIAPKVTTVPTTFSSSQNSGLLAALARQKTGTATATDNSNLAYAQKNGWSAPTDTSVVPTATGASNSTGITSSTSPATNSQGLTAQQMSDYASGKIDINGNPITNASTVGKIVNSSASAPAAVAPAIKNLNDVSSTNPGNSGPANDAYQSTLQKIQDLQANYAKQSGEIAAAGGDVNWNSGQKGALDQAFNVQLQGLQNLASAQANALGYQISGVQAQQSGYNEAGTLAQNAQGQTQSGLAQAGQLSLPQQVPYGTPLVSPQTGVVLGSDKTTFTGNFNDTQNQQLLQAQQRVQSGTGSDTDKANLAYAQKNGWSATTSAGSTTGGEIQPSDPFYKTMQSYAQLMVNNQGSAIPASITGNSVLNAQLIKMAKQINPNFNVNVASGLGAAQSSVAGAQAAQVQNWTSSLQQAKALQSQAGDLIKSLGLNPSDLTDANKGIQLIANHTSSTGYQILSNYLNEIASVYSNILTPSGGSQTDTTRSIATGMINGLASGQSIQDVMNAQDVAAATKISQVPTSAGMGTSGSSGSSSSANSTSGTTSSGVGYTITTQ